MNAGQQLGPYVLEEELGRGGMGVVWRARDAALDRTVAIKVLLRALATPVELERFRREALAQARLRHPAIVGVHVSGETPEGQPYLVLDYVDGTNLRARLREGPLPVGEAVRLVTTLARAVSYAHSRGVLHRDLKASNVLIDPLGEPVLIDFGLAAIAGSQRLTATGQMMGTPGCMAPEQVTGEHGRIGPRTDVYGLGVILHEALTARPPFDAEQFLRLLDDIVARPVPPPSHHRPGLDPRLDAIVLRCLEKDPDRRWPTALALAQALEDLRRPSPSGRPARALLLGVALGAAGWAAFGPSRAGPEPRGDVAAATTLAPAAPTVQVLVAEAERAARGGDLQAALRALDRAVSLSSTLEALSARALLCVRLGDQAGARRDLRELAGRSDPLALVVAARGLSLTDEGDALEVSERAVSATGGRDARALAARALARSGRGDRAGALADAQAGARLEQDEPTVLLAQGWLALEADPLPLLERARRVAEERGDDLVRAVASTGLARARLRDLARAEAAQLALARTDLDEAVRLAPALRRALRQRAAVRLTLATRAVPLDRDLIGEVVRDATKLCELAPQEVGIVELLAYARSRLALDAARGLDLVEARRALADLTLGLARSPASAVLLAARGELAASVGDFVAAEADARAALAASGGPVVLDRATALLARLRGRRGAVTEGLAVLEPLLAGGAAAPHALAERSVLRSTLREAAAARADAERALALDPALARGHFALARALVLSGTPAELSRARAALTEAARLLPGFAQALSDLALLRAKLGEATPRETLDELQRVQRLEPWAAEHLANQAVYLEALGDSRGSADALERALTIEPLSSTARLQRGRRRALDAPESALVDLLLVVERQPWGPDAHFYLAVARRALKEEDLALRDVSRALELEPRASVRLEALLLRAELRADREDWPAALADLERAVALEPAAARDTLERLVLACPAGAPRSRAQALLDAARAPR